MDLWDYIYSYVRLKLKTGETFTGDVIAVFGAEEVEEREDSLSLEVRQGQIYGFFASEIQTITRLNRNG